MSLHPQTRRKKGGRGVLVGRSSRTITLLPPLCIYDVILTYIHTLLNKKKLFPLSLANSRNAPPPPTVYDSPSLNPIQNTGRVFFLEHKSFVFKLKERLRRRDYQLKTQKEK